MGSDDSGPFAEQWTGGTSWHLISMPIPKFEPFTMSGVSCSARLHCEAVGGGLTDQPPLGTFTLAMALTGISWRVQRTGQFDALPAVSCVSSTHCQTIGNFATKQDNNEAMAQSWNGTTWRLAKPRRDCQLRSPTSRVPA